jgi:hypothetical protein
VVIAGAAGIEMPSHLGNGTKPRCLATAWTSEGEVARTHGSHRCNRTGWGSSLASFRLECEARWWRTLGLIGAVALGMVLLLGAAPPGTPGNEEIRAKIITLVDDSPPPVPLPTCDGAAHRDV